MYNYHLPLKSSSQIPGDMPRKDEKDSKCHWMNCRRASFLRLPKAPLPSPIVSRLIAGGPRTKQSRRRREKNGYRGNNRYIRCMASRVSLIGCWGSIHEHPQTHLIPPHVPMLFPHRSISRYSDAKMIFQAMMQGPRNELEGQHAGLCGHNGFQPTLVNSRTSTQTTQHVLPVIGDWPSSPCWVRWSSPPNFGAPYFDKLSTIRTQLRDYILSMLLSRAGLCFSAPPSPWLPSTSSNPWLQRPPHS